MNILGLFDGISCGQIALQRAGVQYDNYYASEIDPHAIKVTQHHFPSTVQLGDVTQISGADLPQIDLLCGGSPCQGMSSAGKRLGLEDPRSKLFWEFVRLLKETKPRYFLLENVVMTKADQAIITEALCVEAVEIDSAALTAQHRRRLYWTNIPFSKTIEDKGVVIADILDSEPDPSCYLSAKGIKRTTNSAYAKKLITKDTEKTGTLLAGYYKIGGGHYYVQDDKGIRMFTPTECEKLQSLPPQYTSLLSRSQRYKSIGNGWTVDIIAHIFRGLL
jgi:site-specific DNA-cytosine methylase